MGRNTELVQSTPAIEPAFAGGSLLGRPKSEIVEDP
jgi:hypothetical protein